VRLFVICDCSWSAAVRDLRLFVICGCSWSAAVRDLRLAVGRLTCCRCVLL